MLFAESAIASIDVSASTALVGPPFADILRASLAGLAISSSIEAIVFFPTIIDPRMGVMPDKITYRRSEPAVYIKVNINHGAWASASFSERVSLYADALKRGISQIRESKLRAEDREKLAVAVDAAAHQMKLAA